MRMSQSLPLRRRQGCARWKSAPTPGAQPSDACPARRSQWFAEDRLPLPKEKDLWQKLRMVRGSDELANEFTPPDQIEERVYKIYPLPYRDWAEQHGIPQPPLAALTTPEPGQVRVGIADPPEGMVVSGVVNVVGSASVPDFASYELQYGISHDPGAFSLAIYGPVNSPVTDGQLGSWDVSGLENGPHTLRLLVRDAQGRVYEARSRVYVENTPPTPAQEPTATWTPEPPTPEWTPEPPTATAEPLPPTDTPVPSPPPRTRLCRPPFLRCRQTRLCLSYPPTPQPWWSRQRQRPRWRPCPKIVQRRWSRLHRTRRRQRRLDAAGRGWWQRLGVLFVAAATVFDLRRIRDRAHATALALSTCWPLGAT